MISVTTQGDTEAVASAVALSTRSGMNSVGGELGAGVADRPVAEAAEGEAVGEGVGAPVGDTTVGCAVRGAGGTLVGAGVVGERIGTDGVVVM